MGLLSCCPYFPAFWYSFISAIKVTYSTLPLRHTSLTWLIFRCPVAGVQHCELINVSYRPQPGRVKKCVDLVKRNIWHFATHLHLFRAFSPAESLMRVPSVETGSHNIKVEDVEGWAQISVYALYCRDSHRTVGSFFYSKGELCYAKFPVQSWTAHKHTHTLGDCGFWCSPSKPAFTSVRQKEMIILVGCLMMCHL